MLPTQSWDCPRELRLAEQVALQHFRNHAPRAVVETVEPVQAESRMKRSSFSPSSLSLLQEEHVLLEASVARIRPQRAPRGAKKLQSSSYDLLPDCGAAGTADATAELIPDYAEAHMAPAHPPVARRSTHQTSEPGENSGASSLLSHDGCDVSPPWPQVVPTQFKTPVWLVARRLRGPSPAELRQNCRGRPAERVCTPRRSRGGEICTM